MMNKGGLALFGDHDDAVIAADRLKTFGIDDFEILSGSPYPEGAFGERPSYHRLYAFPLVGAALGLSVAILITAGTQLAYPLVTGGKPILALPPMFIVSYEGTMLGAILFTILGVLFESRLPRPGGPGLYDPRITEGYVGIAISVPAEQVEQVTSLFNEANAADVKIE